MRPPNKKKFEVILIVLLITLSILFRLPVTPHAKGFDGFSMHVLANTISEEGFIQYTLHPLSIVGVYPLSYPAGIPTLFSGLSTLLGINNIEMIILFTSMLFGVIAAISMYALSGFFTGRRLFKFFAAFSYSLSNIYISLSNFSGNARVLFIAIIPLFIWSLLIFNQEKKLKYAVLSIILFIVMTTIHRSFFISIAVILIFVLALVFDRFKNTKVLNVLFTNKRFSFLLILTLVFFIIIGMFLVGTFRFASYKLDTTSEYDKFMIFDSAWLRTLNYQLVGVGALSILVVPGVFFLFLKRNKKFEEYFLILLIMFFGLLITEIQYSFQYSLFIYSLLIGYGVVAVSNYLLNRRLVFINRTFILGSILFTFSILSYILLTQSYTESRIGEQSWAREDLHRSALFYKNVDTNKTIASNVMGGMVTRFSAYSEKRYSVPDEVLYLSFIDKNTLNINVTVRNLESYLHEFRSPLGLQGLNIFRDQADMFYYNLRHPRTEELIDNYEIGYYLENTWLDGNYMITGEISKSRILTDLNKEKNRIYDNGRLAIWQID